MAPKDCSGARDYGTMQKVSENKSEDQMRVQRNVTLLDAITIMVGSIIGSGIFVAPKGVFSAAGSLGAGLLVWLFSGIFSMLGIFCFMELGTSIGRSGGEYAYLLEAFGPLVAFLHLWVNMIVRQPAALAIIALCFAEYVFKPFFTECETPAVAVRLMAAAVLSLMTYLNCTSIKLVMRVQGIFTVAKLAALLAIIVAGLVHIGQGNTENLAKSFEGETRIDMLALSFYSGLFAYLGWHFLTLITEEIQDPARNLPRASFIAIIIVTSVYVMVNVAYIAVLPAEEILVSPAIAVSFGNVMFGPLAWTVPVAVAISTIGSINGGLFTSSRVLLVGAQDQQLPSFLAMLDLKNCNPIPAILITGLMAILMLIVSDIYALISYLSFSMWLTFGGCAVGLLWLRHKRPDMDRPVRVNLFIPVIFLVGCVALLILPLMADPWNTSIGAAIILTGFPAYYLIRLQHEKSRSKPKQGRQCLSYSTSLSLDSTLTFSLRKHQSVCVKSYVNDPPAIRTHGRGSFMYDFTQTLQHFHNENVSMESRP